jgi:polyferredoxin
MANGLVGETAMLYALEPLASAVTIGCGATLVMDVWALGQRRLLGIASLDYAMVGRWLGHMPNGVFRHTAIAQSPPVPGERAIGWVAHYAIGIAFSAVLLGVWSLEWVRRPTLTPALIVGLGSVAAPFLIMQPAMGAGIAASRTLNPWAARIRSMVAHLAFGIGLYVSGVTRQMLLSL